MNAADDLISQDYIEHVKFLESNKDYISSSSSFIMRTNQIKLIHDLDKHYHLRIKIF